MSTRRETSVEAGIGLGTAIAVVISWSVNKSIFWCVIHGVCSWAYVLYFHGCVR